ncbi:MAG: hypothetical protein K0U98_27575 [Deltaproteobacteria bacterium]|nr:hypothetical protein [Deltaproteobacteria bacterium]
MKIAKALAFLLLASLVLFGFGKFFVSQLGNAQPDEVAGAILAPLPDVIVEEAGKVSTFEAAAALTSALQRQGSQPRVGIHFWSEGRELYWVADRSDPAAPVLVERAASPRGTRLETRWIGKLEMRLAWARQHGSFDVPTLPPGESRNLYH